MESRTSLPLGTTRHSKSSKSWPPNWMHDSRNEPSKSRQRPPESGPFCPQSQKPRFRSDRQPQPPPLPLPLLLGPPAEPHKSRVTPRLWPRFPRPMAPPRWSWTTSGLENSLQRKTRSTCTKVDASVAKNMGAWEPFAPVSQPSQELRSTWQNTTKAKSDLGVLFGY